MIGGESGVKDENYQSNDEEDKKEPRARVSALVTPKMLIKALKRLKKTSFKRLLFTPREITHEILSTYPLVDQDSDTLLLEVSDKLTCAAAAGLLGTKQDLGYFAFDPPQEATRADSRSELMFWIYYKKLLKKKKEKSTAQDTAGTENWKRSDAILMHLVQGANDFWSKEFARGCASDEIKGKQLAVQRSKVKRKLHRKTCGNTVTVHVIMAKGGTETN